jgi:hypothetical protein
MPQTRAAFQPSEADRRAALEALARRGIQLQPDDPEVEVWARRQKVRQELSTQNLHFELDNPQLDTWARRIDMRNAFATFAHPNAFAGYLALLLPALVGWAGAAAWRGPSAWQGRLAGVCVATMGVALWLTHSRGALLGTGIALTLLAAFLWREPLRRHRLAVLGLVVLAGLALLVFAGLGGLTGKDTRTAGYRLDYWAATWAMIRDHPWLGVGPGNFGRAYPGYMLETAFEKVQDPHNFLLEIWSTAGLFALLALLTAFAALAWHTRSAWRLPASAQPDPAQAAFDPTNRWAFYLGGMAGLLLGFLLRASDLSGDAILVEGVNAGGRSLVWFAAFALLDGIPWGGPARVVALLAGLLALLVNLLVSGGISLPSVALPLWVVAALALNGIQTPPVLWEPRHWLTRWAPVPLAAAVALTFVVLVLQPVTGSATLARTARDHVPLIVPRLRSAHDRLAKEASPDLKRRALAALAPPLRANLIEPLEQAAALDPGAPGPLTELATWYTELWKLDPGNPEPRQKALAALAQAQRLDPQGKENYLIEAIVHREFAQADKPRAVEHHARAASALRGALRADPTEARLWFELAEALDKAAQPVERRRAAEEALRLDALATQPSRKLDDRQREQVRNWTG